MLSTKSPKPSSSSITWPSKPSGTSWAEDADTGISQHAVGLRILAGLNAR